jgi:tRNA-Thr(GGU) m(6)t(6)A37 methyltransferase TsaA
MESYRMRPVGYVESTLTERADAPKQGFEGAPDATVVIADEYAAALDGVVAGTSVLVLTWLDRADRGVLTTHPRDDPANPLTGVFATRSPDRPNPVGVHRVRVLEVEGTRLRVADLEALDGTPVVDVKAVLPGDGA